MTVSRLLPAMSLVLAGLVLTACAPGGSTGVASPAPQPEPSATATLDPRALEELMFEALPPEQHGFVTSRATGTAEPTFGFPDHDAKRSARALIDFESAGWADSTLGPAFWATFEIVLMPSVQAADAVMNDVAAGAREPYTIESEGPDMPQYEYAPIAPPGSGRWPVGTVEQARRMVWPTGERSDGWIVWSSSGPFVTVVAGSAIPDDASAAALEAFVDGILPAYLERLAALPDAL